MTIVNARCNEHELLIATDTQSYVGTGTPGFLLSKVVALPHLGAAIAWRGHVQLFAALSSAVLTGAGGNSFDEMIGGVVDLVGLVIDTNLKLRGQTAKRRDLESYQLIVGGWSDAAQEMQLHYFDSKPGRPVEPIDIPWLISPAVPGAGPDDLATPDSIVALMERQRTYAAELVARGEGCGVIGGDVILLGLTRDHIRIRRVHRFAEVAAAAG